MLSQGDIGPDDADSRTVRWLWLWWRQRESSIECRTEFLSFCDVVPCALQVRQILSLQKIKQNGGYLKGHIVVELQVRLQWTLRAHRTPACRL